MSTNLLSKQDAILWVIACQDDAIATLCDGEQSSVSFENDDAPVELTFTLGWCGPFQQVEFLIEDVTPGDGVVTAPVLFAGTIADDAICFQG